MKRDQWNQFVLAHGPRSGAFLQSWEWGEFQRRVGETVERQVVGDDADPQGVAQWLVRSLPGLGMYRYCPKGPIGDVSLEETNVIFSRVEPESMTFVSGARSSIELNPAHSLLTDLSENEDDLFAQMHRKTRYNIRLSNRKGVEVQMDDVNFEDVWLLFEQTANRGGFHLHSKSYYQKMLASLREGVCRAFLATAWHEMDLLAANVMIDFGQTRTYLHGASSNTKRNLMAPYALHWELMKDARSKGMETYDWWGVAPPDADDSHAWSGISRFKRGFGGEEYASHGTLDLVHQPLKYQLYQIMRWARRKLRS